MAVVQAVVIWSTIGHAEQDRCKTSGCDKHEALTITKLATFIVYC